MTSRVPAATEVEIGTLLRDPQGDLYVVTCKDGIAYSTTELDEVIECPGEAWDEREASAGWLDNCYPQTLAGTAAPEVLAVIFERTAYKADVVEAMSHVAPADHHRLYNTLAGFHHWDGKLATAQRQVNEYSKHRAGELRKLVEILGSQDRVAKLLGTNQSTISRALRDR